MIIKHKDLVEKAKKFLIKKGFKETEIFEEYPVTIAFGRQQRVDVVGINKDSKIAIECGGVHKDLDLLKPFFDDVIILPYVNKSGNKFHCSYCDYNWISRVEVPKQCPNCKRYFILNTPSPSSTTNLGNSPYKQKLPKTTEKVGELSNEVEE